MGTIFSLRLNLAINELHCIALSVLGRIRVLLAKGTGTNEINAECVPWNVLNILFDGNLPALEMALLLKETCRPCRPCKCVRLGIVAQ